MASRLVDYFIVTGYDHDKDSKYCRYFELETLFPV